MVKKGKCVRGDGEVVEDFAGVGVEESNRLGVGEGVIALL
jgi:hypothetical protein